MSLQVIPNGAIYFCPRKERAMNHTDDITAGVLNEREFEGKACGVTNFVQHEACSSHAA